MTALRLLLLLAASLAVLAPSWWAVGRLQDRDTAPFFRLLIAAGFALVAYLTVVNLTGRVLEQGTWPAAVLIVGGAVAAIGLRRVDPDGASFRPLWTTWRDWIGLVALALVLGFPQWLLAVSTPYWDEIASSAIHVTGANQFAEGVFPPRHNALPEIATKYHYAFIVLSGSVRWLSGLSANVSIDVVTVALWLFTFLFVVQWFRALRMGRAPSLWAGVATLVGGGLSWAVLPRVEAFSSFEVTPGDALRLHRWDAGRGYVENLLATMQVPSAHLRNGDGTISNLPWDVAAQFQQHAVAVGIPLALFALYLLVAWQRRASRRTSLLIATVLTFGVAMLAHAVFGGVAALTAGVLLLGRWLYERTWQRFVDGVLFGLGVAAVAFAHGGMLAVGAQYGAAGEVLAFRDTFGYSRGGVVGFALWNVVGFGVPLLLLPFAVRTWLLARRSAAEPATDLSFVAFGIFALISWLIPQLTYYASETSGVEQFTEVSKFFFSARIGFALLSAWGVAWLVRRRVRWTLLPLAAAMAVAPLAFVVAHSTRARPDGAGRQWLGFYRAPYHPGSVEEQMGRALGRLKSGNTETYFDASADERIHGFLSELLLFGGSVFTATPSRFERTGVGFRLSERVVAERYVQNGRMARLAPGGAEACGCRWYYAKPVTDMAFAPIVVRARFAKMLDDSILVARHAVGPRVLYEVARPTHTVDDGLDRYWRPRLVQPATSLPISNGRATLAFYDLASARLHVFGATWPLPSSEIGQVYVARPVGARQAGLLFARLRDTEFRLGRRISENVEHSSFGWSVRAAGESPWGTEYLGWQWTGDIPLVADLNADGIDTHFSYRPRTGEWFEAPMRRLPGPTMPAATLPVPFGGRFLRGSVGDLALWSRANLTMTLHNLTTGEQVTFPFGTDSSDVLVPADYDGDGFAEVATWHPGTQVWTIRSPAGRLARYRFGTPTAVPMPTDYNRDGRVDLAYWEPMQSEIVVSFDRGATVGLRVPVPRGSVPAFVNVF